MSSRRLLFREGEGHRSLSPSRVESGRSDLWKRVVSQNYASYDHSFPVITHSAPGAGPVVMLIGEKRRMQVWSYGLCAEGARLLSVAGSF